MGIPPGDGADVVCRDGGLVLTAQEVFEQDAQRIGQTAEVEALGLERGEPGEPIGAPSSPEGVEAFKTIAHHRGE